MISSNQDNDWIGLTKKNQVSEFDHNVTNQINVQDETRLGKRVDVEIELPEDYFNRQKLYIPKR